MTLCSVVQRSKKTKIATANSADSLGYPFSLELRSFWSVPIFSLITHTQNSKEKTSLPENIQIKLIFSFICLSYVVLTFEEIVKLDPLHFLSLVHHTCMHIFYVV